MQCYSPQNDGTVYLSRDQNPFRYWTPAAPDRISSIDFGDWTRCPGALADDLVCLRRPNTPGCLFWHVGLAVGVEPRESDRMVFRNGGIFVTVSGYGDSSRFLFVPLLLHDSGASPAPATRATRVPDSLPKRSARVVGRPAPGHVCNPAPLLRGAAAAASVAVSRWLRRLAARVHVLTLAISCRVPC